MLIKDTKTNNIHIANKMAAARTDVGIIYQHDSQSLGLTALFEGYKLYFSGGFGEKTFAKTKWQALSKFIKKQSQLESASIISKRDIYKIFSPNAKRTWLGALNLAKNRKDQLGVEDIFLALLDEPSVKNLLERLKVNPEDAKILVNNYLHLTRKPSVETVKLIPFEAFCIATKLHNHKVGSLMLLGALLKTTPQNNILQAIFTNIGLSYDQLELFTVWSLNLNYHFPPGSSNSKYLYCCQQAETLEKHFGYFFELSAIELALILSVNTTFKDLERKKALQILVKAAGLAKSRRLKRISENLVKEAAGK